MKKIVVVSIVLLVGLTATAQSWGWKKIKGNGKMTTEKRTTPNYDKISIAGSLDVELFKGEEGEITVKAEENLMEYIITEVKGGDLLIKIKDGYSIKYTSKNTIFITVPFQDIKSVSLSGSGDVYLRENTVVEASNFSVNLTGSGDLDLTLSTDKVKANVAGSGDLNLQGETSSFKCSVAGSGDIHAYKLKAKNVDANVAGSGDVNVYCNGLLKANIVGSGDISYKGKPEKEESRIVGSGSVSEF